MFIIPAKQLASFIPGCISGVHARLTSPTSLNGDPRNECDQTEITQLTRVFSSFTHIYCMISIRVLNKLLNVPVHNT